MSIAIFFVLALLSAAFIVYPLLPGRSQEGALATISDREIEQAVRRFRPLPAGDGTSCPTCGDPFKPGDRFCVSCGGALPASGSGSEVCPSCGASLQADDQFCSKCGHRLAGAEVG